MQLFRAGGRDTWPRMPSHLYVASLGITAAAKNNAHDCHVNVTEMPPMDKIPGSKT